MALPVVRISRPVRTQYVRRNPNFDLHQQLNRPFEQVVGALLAQQTGPRRAVTPWAPVAGVTTDEQAYTLDVEVPGLKRDDVSIELAERTLTVSGQYGPTATEQSDEQSDEQSGEPSEGSPEPTGAEVSTSEVARPARTLRSGRFEYRRTLPADVDRENVAATLADGVLTLVLPRVAKPAARRVEITEG